MSAKGRASFGMIGGTPEYSAEGGTRIPCHGRAKERFKESSSDRQEVVHFE